MTLDDKIAAAPKADLHVHLEGTIQPEMILRLAARNDMDPGYATVADLQAAYEFANLGDFLKLFYAGLRVMRTRQDFYDVTRAFLQRSAEDTVVYTEIHFSPQSHIERGVGWTEMMDGILQACADAQTAEGITGRLILGLQRHRTEAAALEIIEQALPWRHDIVALGLGGAEIGNPPSKFHAAYCRARDLGWRCTCHAGEEGPAAYVTEALDILKVDRIDHGNRATDDPALVARLGRERVPMTVCPYSNLRLKVEPSLAESRLATLLRANCHVSVNTDDPSYFGAWANRNLIDTGKALDLTPAQIAAVIRNGFTGAFCPDDQKAALVGRFDDYWASC